MSMQQPTFGKKTPYTLFSLPGFLGHPSDWKGIIVPNELWEHCPCDYYSRDFAPPGAGFGKWADSFNRYAARATQHPRLLVGYSLGGRLAMHALCRAPELWSGAILVSAHPGLPKRHRLQRLKSDEQWACRFETEPFGEVLADWNNQELFDGTPFPAPRPSDGYDRSLLASTLRFWSLGRQNELTHQLTSLPFPVLWIAGARDERYSALTKTLRFQHPLSHSLLITGAAHRVPWQQPAFFQAALVEFCTAIQQQQEIYDSAPNNNTCVASTREL